MIAVGEGAKRAGQGAKKSRWQFSANGLVQSAEDRTTAITSLWQPSVHRLWS